MQTLLRMQPEECQKTMQEQLCESLVHYLTTIVPVIEGWMAQEYTNVPVSTKVKENVCPLLNWPELNVADVIWWGAESLFVHVTASPFLIASVDGANEKFLISTAFGIATVDPCAGAELVTGTGEPCWVFLYKLHPPSRNAPINTNSTVEVFLILRIMISRLIDPLSPDP